MAQPSRRRFYAIDNQGNQGNHTVYHFDDDGIELQNFPVDYGTLPVRISAYWNNIDSSGFLYFLSWTQPFNIGSAISKIDALDGSVVWHRELVSTGDDPVNGFIPQSTQIFVRGVAFNSIGELIVAGSFQDDGTSTRACIRCPFIVSFNADGNDLWLRELETFTTCGRSGDGQLFRLAVGGDDTFYVAGMSEAIFTEFSDGVLSRFSADGATELWSYCHASEGDKNAQFFSPPLLTADGNVLLYGHEEADVDPVTLLRESAQLLLYKLQKDGSVLWLQTINTTKADGMAAYTTSGSVAENSQGVIYLSGQTDREVTSAANAGAADVFLIRRRPDGSPE